MNIKGEAGTFGIIITIFVAIVFALALLPNIANNASLVSDRQSVANNSLLYAAPVAGNGQINTSFQMNLSKVYPAGDWRRTSGDCVFSITGITNNNGTALVLDTDYAFTNSIGNLTLLNTFKTNWTVLNGNNLTLVNYTYCDAGYSTDSASRASIDLIATLLIIALVASIIVGIKKDWD